MSDSKHSQPNAQEDPGSIITEKKLTLHTKEALKIFYGRKPDPEKGIHEIIGLSIYATMLRTIWGACLAGDPYARWWIQKLETRLNEAEEDLKHLSEEIDVITSRINNRIDLSESEATHPVTVPLNYGTPYMFKIVFCLIQVDELVAKMINLRHMAIISPGDFDLYKKNAVATIYRILDSTKGFKNLEVTDQDISEANDKAQEATQKMGQLPEEILSGKYVPELMPTKKVRVFGFNRPKSKPGAKS